MSEHLVIRVGTTREQPLDWVILADDTQTLIASGRLECAAIAQLTQHATGRVITLLIPASTCIFKTLTVPKGQHISDQAMLYQMEDALASDVEQLHLVVCKRAKEQVHVIALEKAVIKNWLNYFQELGLTLSTMIPDALTLPLPTQENAWSALQIEDQWLIRQSAYQGMSVETSWLPALMNSFTQQQTIIHYSPAPEQTQSMPWQPAPFEMPMALLAKGCLSNKINLLTGSFRQENLLLKQWKPWKKVAIVASIAFTLAMLDTTANLYKLAHDQTQINEQIKTLSAQILPPGTRIVNAKMQVQAHIEKLKRANEQDLFLTSLSLLTPSLQSTPDMQIDTVSFEASSQQLTLQVQAENFEQLDQFKAQAQQVFDVDMSEMRQTQTALVGTIRLRKLP